MTVAALEPMAADHDVQLFLSSVESLDHWLKQYAPKIRRTEARAFVACDGHRVLAGRPSLCRSPNVVFGAEGGRSAFGSLHRIGAAAPTSSRHIAKLVPAAQRPHQLLPLCPGAEQAPNSEPDIYSRGFPPESV